MSIGITDNQHYSDIADAIRYKGVTGTFKPSEMAAAITSIPSGGEDEPTSPANDGWERPISMPKLENYFESSYSVFPGRDCWMTYDTSIEEPFNFVSIKCHVGAVRYSWKLETYSVDEITHELRLVASKTYISNTTYRSVLPSNYGRYVVYHVQPADTSSTAFTVSLDSSNGVNGYYIDGYYQPAVEIYCTVGILTSNYMRHLYAKYGSGSYRNVFYGQTNLEAATLKIGTLSSNNLENTFNFSRNIRRITVSADATTGNAYLGCVSSHMGLLEYVNFEQIVNDGTFKIHSYMSNIMSLRDVYPCELYTSCSFSGSNALSHDSLIRIINKLQNVETTQTLTIGSVNIAKLTAAEIAIATEKGWAIA